MQEDKRPDPKPRKNIHLWQSYLMWFELMEMRKRHLLRISSIQKGKSLMDEQLEHNFLEYTNLDTLICTAKKTMVNFGVSVGPVWSWITFIRGLGEGSLAAQLLAQIDDIGKFDTVSKLWRFAGQAVIDGKAETNTPGQKSSMNNKLRGICWNIGEQFVKQQTPLYVDIYYSEKERQRILHPDVVCKTCTSELAFEVPWDDCPNKKHKRMYNDGHIHNRAKRKAIKIFLQHLWVNWRELEGLPVSDPYVKAVLKHTNII